MCHPWLAASVTGFVGVLAVREFVPVFMSAAPPRTADAPATGFLGVRLRVWFRARMGPLAEALEAIGLTANGVTLSQLVASIGCGYAYARGWMFTAGWTLIACGTLDVLDGEMARRRGQAGPRGAFIDSVVDRYGEGAVFAGLVVFYRDEWVLWVVLGAWLGAYLVSYARARAEGLGIDCREGLLQRPERYVVLGGTSMASALAHHFSCTVPDSHALVALGLAVVALLAHVTAFQRAAATLRQLT